MRKEWMEPVIEVQEFVANEYVAACGDSGMVYKFKCDAGEGPYAVYVDTNNNGKLDLLKDQLLGDYQACGATHDASVRDEFLNGFIRKRGVLDKYTPVVIWRGEDGHNIHCTTELDINKWTTAKS